MARTQKLYNRDKDVVGIAEYTKKFIVRVCYDDKLKYSDTNVPLNEFDAYKARMGLKLETELNQLELF